MRALIVRTLCAAVVGAGAAAPAGGQVAASTAAEPTPTDTLVLTLREVQRLAVERNPEFLASRLDTAIARGELRQAGLYQFNPEVNLVAPGVPAGGGGSPVTLQLTQQVEWAGQRGLRVGAAKAGLTRASATVRNAGRLTLAEASIAFARAIAADRRRLLAEQVLSVNERLLQAVRIQLREGEVSSLEANLAEIEFGRARARVLSARRQASSASLELKRLVGVTPATPIRFADDSIVADAFAAGVLASIDADSLSALALVRRPDVAARTAAVHAAQAQASLARREAVPNLLIGAIAERERDGGSPAVGLVAGVGIPRFNRNQGRADALRAQAAQAELEVRAAQLRVRTEVTAAASAYAAAAEEAAVYEAAVLQPARKNSALLESAFRAGKLNLMTLLLLRNQLLDAELGYWDAWLARREASVLLESSTGALSLDPTTIPTPAPRTPR